MSSARAWFGCVALVGLLATTSLGGCGSDDPEPADDDSAQEPTSSTEADDTTCRTRGESAEDPAVSVAVGLGDFTMEPSPVEVPAGPVEFVAANDGDIWHELIVVRHDGDSGTIPLNPVGGADLDQLGSDAEVGRIINFMAGVTCRATFDLEPGRYALVCNLVDDGANPHYSRGMHAAFTVTG